MSKTHSSEHLPSAIGCRIPKEMSKRIDILIEKGWYATQSDFFREALRSHLFAVENQINKPEEIRTK